MKDKKSKGTKIRRSKGDVAFDMFIYVVLGFAGIIVAYPLWFIVVASVSNPNAFGSGRLRFYRWILLWEAIVIYSRMMPYGEVMPTPFFTQLWEPPSISSLPLRLRTLSPEKAFPAGI